MKGSVHEIVICSCGSAVFCPRVKELIGSGMDGKNRRYASAFAVGISIHPTAPQRTSGRSDQNAALCMQIIAYQRKRKRPLPTTLDRVFCVMLRSVWSDWRHPLIYIQVDTVAIGSANGSANSGPGCPSPSAGVAVAPAQPQNSAD
jgi:hypothetical protein